jgi:thimet oligopeptidase
MSIDGDAAEAPSTLMEEWIWDPRTLSTFSRHYETGEQIPVRLVEQLQRSRDFGKALDAERQVFQARVALDLHLQALTDPAAVIREALGPAPLVHWADGSMIAQFTHLVNDRYTSSYYTYLWSRAIAKDLFSRFDRSDLLAQGPATRFRDAVLAKGAAKPASELFKDFLGRPFSADAYLRWLNAE